MPRIIRAITLLVCLSPLPLAGTQITGTLNAGDFPGVDWLARVNAAAAALPHGGTIDVPDSIAGIASTVGAIPGNVTLQFTGSGRFGFCQLNVGQFSKIFNRDALLQIRGPDCIGINQSNRAILQTTDKFLLDGVRIDCDQQPNSTGIFVGAGHAQTSMRNVTVANCTNTALRLDGAQFGEYWDVSLYHNLVGLKIYTTLAAGGGNSNTFYGLKALGNTVGVLIAETAKFGMGPDYFINPSLLSNSVAAMAVFGNLSQTDVHWYGGAPEVNGGGASSVTIDNHLIKQASIYANHARITLSEVTVEEATISPFIRAENDSTITLDNLAGYGRWDGTLVSSDRGSTTTLAGRLDAIGTIENVVAYPSVIRSTGYLRMFGIPADIEGQPVPLAIADSKGALSAVVASDPNMGKIVTVRHAPISGSQENNRINFGDVAPSAAGDVLVSMLIKSPLNCSYNVAAYGDGNGRIRIPLQAGVWTRVVIFRPKARSGKAFTLVGWPDDESGPSVSFTRLNVASGPGYRAP